MTTKSPPADVHDCMSHMYPSSMLVIAPIETRPSASQRNPTQLPDGVSTPQPTVAQSFEVVLVLVQL